jgi:hypothetical protein
MRAGAHAANYDDDPDDHRWLPRHDRTSNHGVAPIHWDPVVLTIRSMEREPDSRSPQT